MRADRGSPPADHGQAEGLHINARSTGKTQGVNVGHLGSVGHGVWPQDATDNTIEPIRPMRHS